MTIKTPPTKLVSKKDNITKYEGESKDDGTPHGHGTYTFSDGDKYIGEYQHGEKHGQGTYIYNYGDKYEGGFKNGLRHGQGTYTFADGHIIKGYFKNNLRLLT